MDPIAAALTWTGTVATVLALVVGVLAYWHSNPRRRVTYTIESVSLLSTNAPDGLTLTVRGQRIKSPYLTTIQLSSKSRKDIRASDFDSGAPITVSVDASQSMVTRTEGSRQLVVNLFEKQDRRGVQIAPQLLHPNDWVTVDMVTEGKPDVTIDSSLVDIKLVDTTTPAPTGRKLRARAWVALATMTTASLAVAASSFLTPDFRAGYVVVGAAYFATMLSSAALLRTAMDASRVVPE